jgi:hypothetical protein
MLSFSLNYETNWNMSVSLAIPEGTKLMSEWPGQPPTHDLFPAQTTIPRVDLICTHHMYELYICASMLCCIYIPYVIPYMHSTHMYDTYDMWHMGENHCRMYVWYILIRESFLEFEISFFASRQDLQHKGKTFYIPRYWKTYTTRKLDCYNKEEFRLIMIIC